MSMDKATSEASLLWGLAEEVSKPEGSSDLENLKLMSDGSD
jgi:hypothetical protein